MKQVLFALTFVLCAAPVAAQVDVGYPPPKSPYRDLEFKQEATAFGGYFFAAKDPAGVAPRSGPMGGIRYEVTVGGPAQLVARIARVNSERKVVDPSLPKATRDLGIQAWPIYVADVGLSLNLTGQRSWHGVVPVIYTGVGLASDLDKQDDNDPFNLGTTFALSLAGGLRIVPGGRFQLRADAGTYIYQIKYPTAYYGLTADNTTVLDTKQAKNFWKRNFGLTLGASYLLFR
ncbi:MAG: hypothetical protein ABI556_04215 [Gemmatimonadales bacterium]